MISRAWAFQKAIVSFGIALLAFVSGTALGAQELSVDELPFGLRERAVVMHIISRIIEQDQEVVWNSENTKVTIPGRPVGIKLVGENLIVAVQFTPFMRPTGQHILVAQGQIWINIPNEGISYHTTMQTIPLEFSEQVYFFPLGSMDTRDEAYIEIQLVLEPYSRNAQQEQEHRPGQNRRSQEPEPRSPSPRRTPNTPSGNAGNEGNAAPP